MLTLIAVFLIVIVIQKLRFPFSTSITLIDIQSIEASSFALAFAILLKIAVCIIFQSKICIESY